ncbi:MAG TPA: hypothetical protein VMA77_19575 [Solirubrobacteraceae bacterium]|nr:hypothetical protein [Solirubrobacteraceae bacterium]
MQISDLRRTARDRLLDFAWDEWTQMGVSGAARRTDRWAQDPEALLLFTLEVAREDPRLFGEVLDWLALNERLMSVQRLRNLCRDDADRTLAEAALAWIAGSKEGGQRRQRPSAGDPASAVQLFDDVKADPRRPDAAFRAHGWLMPPIARSGRSQVPNLRAPINFAFRLRQLLGIGARAEAARFLLTVHASSVTAQVVTESAGFAKRNVHEALAALHWAGVVDVVTVANEQRYRIDRERWETLLGLPADGLPTERSWPQLLLAFRALLRWLEDEHHEQLSPYMLASHARTLADEIGPDLRYAGVRVPAGGRFGSEYWEDFVEFVEAALASLG